MRCAGFARLCSDFFNLSGFAAFVAAVGAGLLLLLGPLDRLVASVVLVL